MKKQLIQQQQKALSSKSELHLQVGDLANRSIEENRALKTCSQEHNAPNGGLRRSQAFFKLDKESLRKLAASIPQKELNLTSRRHHPYSSINLDELIKNDATSSTLWGDTLSYENYFDQKTVSDAKTRKAKYLKSEMSFHVNVQYEKNHRLYPLKSMLIKEIRGLLEVLDPIYKKWFLKDGLLLDKKIIFCYFQDAVLEAMLNSKFNNKATEFESAESIELSPVLKKYAVTKARELRAELMLMKFNILVKPELGAELALDENTVKTLLAPLTTFRELVLQQDLAIIDKIKKKLQVISNLIIQAGIMEESNALLSVQLNQALSINNPIIMDFHSFHSLLKNQFEKQTTASKEILSTNTINKIIKEIIKQLSDNFDNAKHSEYLAKLSTVADNNFFLCQEWSEKLTLELSELKLKTPTNEKKIPAYCQAIASEVVAFINRQIMSNENKVTSSLLLR